MPAFKRLATQFIDDNGDPLVGGKLYVGTYGLDPVANPVTIYSDAGLTTPVANPQTLDSFGRPVSDIYVSGDFSYKVTTAGDVQVELKDVDASLEADEVEYQPTGGVARTIWDKLGEYLSVTDYAGADKTGATSSNAAFAAAAAATGSKYVPPGTWKLGSDITLSGHWIFAEGAKIVADAVVTFSGSITAGEYQIAEHGTGSVRWNIDHPIRAAWFGLLAGNTGTQNRTAWDTFIKAQTYATDYAVEIGRGDFAFNATFYLPQRMAVSGLKMFGSTLTMAGSDVHGVEVCYVDSGTITSDGSMAASHVYSKFTELEVFCNNMTFTGSNKRFMFYGAGMSSSLVEHNRFSCSTDPQHQMDGIFLGPTYALDSGSNHFACLRNTVRHNRISNYRDGIVLGRHSQSKTNGEPAGGGSGTYVGGDCYENTVGPRNYLAGEDTPAAAARYGILVNYYNASGYTTQQKPYANAIYCNSIDQTTNSSTSISGTVSVSGSTVTGTGTAFTTELPNDLSSGIGRYLAIRVKDAGGNDQKLRIASIDSDTQLTLATAYSGSAITDKAVLQVMSGVGLFLSSEGHANVAWGNFLDEWCYAVRLSSNCQGAEVWGNYSAGSPYQHVADASDPGDMNFLRHSSASGSELISNFPALGLKGPTELTIDDTTESITVTRSYHQVDTYADAVSDDLRTINASYDGQIVVLQPASASRTVVLKDYVGDDDNLQLDADISLDALSKAVTLIWNAVQGRWFCIGRSS